MSTVHCCFIFRRTGGGGGGGEAKGLSTVHCCFVLKRREERGRLFCIEGKWKERQKG